MASEFLSSEIWETLVQRTRTARRRQFAVSYVSEDSRLRLREGDVLVTDASDGAIGSGQTSAAVLHRAHERGVKIFSCENLHAKVYVCDGWMLVGSANTSANSRSLTEAGISSNDRALVEAAKAWIADLASSGTRVTSRFLRRIEAIPVVRPERAPRRSKPTLLEAIEANLVGLEDLCFCVYSGSQDLKESVVKARAKEEGIVLPKADHWTWYEDDYSRGLQRLTRKKLGDRGLVTFEVSTKQKAITKFESLDESLFTFSDAISGGGNPRHSRRLVQEASVSPDQAGRSSFV